jgi:hypothetical protein
MLWIPATLEKIIVEMRLTYYCHAWRVYGVDKVPTIGASFTERVSVVDAR